jgi:hypothetical protein
MDKLNKKNKKINMYVFIHINRDGDRNELDRFGNNLVADASSALAI